MKDNELTILDGNDYSGILAAAYGILLSVCRQGNCPLPLKLFETLSAFNIKDIAVQGRLKLTHTHTRIHAHAFFRGLKTAENPLP